MRAAIIETPGEIRVGNVEDPTPRAGEVVLRVGACGVCGTDLHIADGEFPPTPYPIVPGHEFAGEVVGVGPGVENISEGGRVAVDPSLFCGRCHFCRRGRGNLCQNWGAIGDTVNGAFAEYVAVPAANAYALPESLSYEEAAIIEPVSCAVRGMHRLSVSVGETVLVVGAGTMGLILSQLVINAGASRVAVADPNTERLARAAELGAASGEGIAELLEEEPLGFDCVIDATGVPAAIEEGLGAVKRGGKFLVFGVAPEEARVSVSPFRIYNDEITLLGSMAVLHSYPQAVDLVAGGVVNARSLLTGSLALDQYPEALDRVRRGEGLKTQVSPLV